MDREQIEGVAAVRGQVAVLCEVRRRYRWLLVNELASLNELAAALSSDDYELWDEGRLAAFDKLGSVIVDLDTPRNWRGVSLVVFREIMTNA